MSTFKTITGNPDKYGEQQNYEFELESEGVLKQIAWIREVGNNQYKMTKDTGLGRGIIAMLQYIQHLENKIESLQSEIEEEMFRKMGEDL